VVPRLSRLQVYYNARRELNPSYVHRDTGATGRSVCKVLEKLGAAPESMWPYTDRGSKFRTPPPPDVVREGEKHQLLEYLSIPHGRGAGELIRLSLAEGYPVGFSLNLREDFKPDEWG